MILWCDSFQGYSDTALNTDLKWDSHTNSGSIVSGGPFGGTCLQLTGYDSRSIRKNLAVNAGTLILGARFKATSAPNGNGHIFTFLDSGTRQMELKLNSSGHLVVSRDGTTLGTGASTLITNLWYYLEYKVTFHNSTGIAVLKLDGNTELNLTGQDTQMSANAYANQIQLGRHDGGFTDSAQFADFVCLDTTNSGISGAPNNDFLGDIRVEAIYPNGNGNSSQFVGSDGNSTDNYLLVDENPENGDTDYVESNTVGNKDTYNYGSVTPTNGLVFGIQVNSYSRKTDAGTRKFKHVVRSATVEQDGPEHTLLTSYRYFSDIREGDPSGNQWTITNVNAMEVGPKVTV